MKKMLRFDLCGSVEVPANFPVGLLYDTHSRRVGEVVSQMEVSDLPELGTVLAARHSIVHSTLIKHGSMIEAIKLLCQYWARTRTAISDGGCGKLRTSATV